MTAKIGDRLVVESEKVGHPTREGEILEVIESPLGTRYQVRWDDGHESTFRPTGGSARIVPAGKKKSATA
ncbi:MAG TPA: DUF1918 domain-containing protein [Candidatus Limnocylindrales bacterium]